MPPDPSRHVMQLVTGRFISQAVGVIARLGVADVIGDGEATTEALARATGTDGGMLGRLLGALAGHGLFRAVPGGWTLTEAGHCLRAGVPGSVRARVLLFSAPEHYAAWGGLEQAVREGKSACRVVFGTDWWSFLAERPELARIFDAAMALSVQAKRDEVLAAYDFSAFATLADIGGGNGALLCAILRRTPALHGILFDRPDVIEGARSLIAAAGCADRCEAVGGSFLERVPAGADAYLLVSILHDWGDEPAAAILATVRAALPRHGRVLVCERVLEPPGPEPDPLRMTDLEMLAMTEGGRERSAAEFEALFARAGLRPARIPRTPGMRVLMEAVAA